MGRPRHSSVTVSTNLPEPGTASISHHAPGLAVVTMRGEHDLSTEPTLSRALAEAAAHSNVLVDFSECSFTDSTVIAAVIQAAQTAHACAKRLVAVIPPEQQGVFRVAEMMGIGDTLAIYRSRESGLAHLEQLMRETEHDWLLPSPPIAIDNG